MTHERGTAPRPVFETLPAAIATALKHDNTLADINVCKWAETYGCQPEQVRAEWERQQWQHTTKPLNICEEYGK